MKAQQLFLERCRQIDALLRSHSEVELLDLAGLLRQLILDGTPLVHKANTDHRLKFRFRVGDFRQPPDQYTTFLMLEDGLDPDTRPPGSPFKDVDLQGLLGHKILFIRGSGQSVSDVISFAANVAGGVHHTENPKDRQKALAEISSYYQVGGLPAGVRQLKAIGRVVLKGLDELIKAVGKDLAA